MEDVVNGPEAEGTEIESQAVGEGQPDKGDYLGRVRSDPEFAVETVRSRDKKVSQLNERLGKFNGLEAYVDAVGSEGLLGYVDYANKVASNPALKQMVDEVLRTGVVPSAQMAQGQTTDDDLFVDPDVKSLRDELSATRAQLEELQRESHQRLAEAETRGFQSGIRDNIGKVMSEWGVTDDVREEMARMIQSRVDLAEKQARQDGPAGEQARNLLRTLSSDQGIETLEYIIQPVIKSNLVVIANARESARTQKAEARSTGSPATARTAGGDANAMAADSLAGTANWVRQVLEKKTKEAGRDPNNLWK